MKASAYSARLPAFAWATVFVVALFTSGTSRAATATWNQAAGGTFNWNANTNPPWNTATFPNAVDDVANLNNNITGNQTINLNQAITIGTLNIGDSSGTSTFYLQPATGALTFDVSAGNATLTKSSGGADRIYAPVTLNDNLDVTISSGSLQFQDSAADISGPGGITKDGSGLLILGGGGSAPTHTFGFLTINEGRVMVFPTSTWSGIGNITINSGVLDWYWSDTFTRALGSGANQIQITGGTSGFGENGNTGLTIRLNNSTSYVAQWGSTYFNPDVLVLNATTAQANAALTWDNPIDLNGATRTIQVNVSDTTGSSRALIQRVISDSAISGAGLIKTGNGVLELNQANTFTGGVQIDNGTVRASHNSALGNGGPLSFTGSGTKLDLRASPTIGNLSGTSNNGLITAGAAGARILTVNQTGNTTFGGVIENGLGTVELVKNGGGNLTLSGANTYTGQTTVSAGQLTISGNNSTRTGLTIVNGTGQLNVAHANALGTGTLQFGGVSGPKIDNTSGAALTLATNNPGNWLGDFTFVGSDDLNLGTGAVSLGGNRNITTTASTLTVGGVISGGFGITKTGAGSLDLSGANTYSGATNINGGTLYINGSLSAGGGDVNINNFGTLGGIGTINRNVNLLAGGTHAVGNSIGIQNVASETWNGGGIFEVEFDDFLGVAGTNWDLLNVAGTLNVNATDVTPVIIKLISLDPLNDNFDAGLDFSNLLIADGGSLTGFDPSYFTFDTSMFGHDLQDGTFSLSTDGNGGVFLNFQTAEVVPEPVALALWSLLGLGLTAFAVYRRRR